MMDAKPAQHLDRVAAIIFLAFAGAYFLSAMLRAVTATLAPVFSAELGIGSADLGLLGGAYFLGFAAMQLPLGQALDRHGAKPVLLALLGVAALACAAFAAARGLTGLVLARACIGVGVSACLMAPLTCYRRLFSPMLQLRANSWMLMTGSLGMLASTLPAQALFLVLGWRGLFLLLGGLLVLSMVAIAACVPRLPPVADAQEESGYLEVARHRLFKRAAPLGFFLYGGMIAVQALWAGPWLTRVCGRSAAEAATGLFVINCCMLLTFMTWGAAMPRLSAAGWSAERLTRLGVPACLMLLGVNIALGEAASTWHWAAWCVSATVVTPMQPALGQAFPSSMAGRALSAYNLVVFSGVFSLQWGIGVAIDRGMAAGWGEVDAFRVSFGLVWVCIAGAYFYFLMGARARHR